MDNDDVDVDKKIEIFVKELQRAPPEEQAALYLAFVERYSIVQKKIEKFERELEEALPDDLAAIFERYITFVEGHRTAVDIQTQLGIRWRYHKIVPATGRVFLGFLIENELADDAFDLFLEILTEDRGGSVSEDLDARHSLWSQCATVLPFFTGRLTAETAEIKSLIRFGIDEEKGSGRVAYLWISLSRVFLIRHGRDQAVAILKEALNSIILLQDFSELRAECKDYYPEVPATEFSLLMFLSDQGRSGSFPLLSNTFNLLRNTASPILWAARIDIFKEKPEELNIVYYEGIQALRRSPPDLIHLLLKKLLQVPIGDAVLLRNTLLEDSKKIISCIGNEDMHEDVLVMLCLKAIDWIRCH